MADPVITGGPAVTGYEKAGTTWTGNTPAPEVRQTTRADIDVLASRVVDLAASGDGVEAGFRTTEFWLTVIAVAADLAGPYYGLNLSDSERMLVASGLVMAYGALRTWRKANGPHKAYADLMAGIADLRKNLFG